MKWRKTGNLCLFRRQGKTQKGSRGGAAAGSSRGVCKHGSLAFRRGRCGEGERTGSVSSIKVSEGLMAELIIYERTPVLSVDGHTARTGQGNVRAEKIVFACHYPFINFPGLYFSRMHQERSYVLALENTRQEEGMYIGAGSMPYSFRFPLSDVTRRANRTGMLYPDFRNGA